MKRVRKLKILMVSPEVYPYAAVGGLSQVTTFLSKALIKKGHQVEILTPAYGGRTYLSTSAGWPKINLVVSPKYFGGSRIYESRRQDLKRFGCFGEALLNFLQRRKANFDIVQAHDWYGALAFSQIKKEYPGLKTVLTVHSPVGKDYSYSYQDQPSEDLENWTDNLVDFAPKDSFLPWQTALAGADLVNTVSPSYSREISPYFKENGELPGIINGIEEEEFRLKQGKEEAKKSLQEKFGLPQKNVPLFVYVGRIVGQKGLPVLTEAMKSFLKEEAQFICLGEGEVPLMKDLQKLKRLFPRKVGLFLKKDFSLPKEIFAGADFLLLPSVVEPCGIVVIEGMKMGAIPIVRSTGGLKDLVKKDYSGLVFDRYEALALEKALREALRLFGNQESFLRVRQLAQEEKFTWDKAARKYEDFYRQ